MSIKVYAPNTGKGQIGGGFRFHDNFLKGMANKVQFVRTWEECDIFFISGVTTTVKEEVYEANKAGKKIVLRIDNVPRKSRNRRSSPHERIKEFADMASVCIYQSEWAKDYCQTLGGDGTVIYNGVDTELFKSKLDVRKHNRYLFAYHGKNEQKNFWEAHLRFQYIFRKDKDAEFWFIYDFGKDLHELQVANFDFWNGENYKHIEKCESAEDMVEVLQQCRHLIYPAIADASPNIVLEALSCGLEVIHTASPELAGTRELLLPNLDISLERMCDEYYGVFQLLV